MRQGHRSGERTRVCGKLTNEGNRFLCVLRLQIVDITAMLTRRSDQ